MNNDRLGRVVLATIVYLSTIEPTAWDCGDHLPRHLLGWPPPAPFFMLLARFLMIFATPETAAVFANSLSALSSSFTILFLFWSITHLAKKMIAEPSGEASTAERWAVMGAGAVGALAYTFSDSFWFSAVEGEVMRCLRCLRRSVLGHFKMENVADEP